MPRRPARTLRVAVPLLTATLVAGGCTSPTEEPDPTAASSLPPSGAAGAAHLDLSGLPVPRADVCGVLAQEDVEQALAGPLGTTGHYANGEEFEVTPGRVDISHEWGCVFEAADGTAARTWIFARPVTRSEAKALVRRARRGRDCAFPESIRFGRPGLTSVCEVPRPAADRATGPTVRARLEGLFGDTWMGCEVSEPLAPATGSAAPRADVVQRAEQWCTEVVTTVAAS